ncbi:Phosphatidate phosphatase/4-nitrophenylphosphatase [Chlorociboria aeruginascens]|nr:Phosphatidate phosphatase/4-nitrophenylphosphatase [Chlorociboria aeruginascens]
MMGKKLSASTPNVSESADSTPSERQILLPLTPPATDECASISDPQSPVSAVLDFLKQRHRCISSDQSLKLTVKPLEYKNILARLEELPKLKGFAGFKLRRLHYDPLNKILHIPPLLTAKHEFFSEFLSIETTVQLRHIASGNDEAARFAAQISSGGSTTMYLTEFDSDNIDTDVPYIRRDPDIQFQHEEAEYPGVVYEIAVSQDSKDLDKAAWNYITHSNGNIKAVVGIELGYGKNKESRISMWQPRYLEGEENIPILDVEALFRLSDGSATNTTKALHLPLDYFAASDVPILKSEGVPGITITYPKLAEFLGKAERYELIRPALGEKRIGMKLHQRTQKRERRSTSPEELSSDKEREFSAAEKKVDKATEAEDSDFEGQISSGIDIPERRRSRRMSNPSHGPVVLSVFESLEGHRAPDATSHASAMQYVRSISGSVSKTWNSINPATLSGAIDVIVVEQEDGSLACSPFHVRFGKFSLLRPFEKKVEFRVNNAKQDYAMKLGEGGEAFFVFETSDNIPEAMQTSPLISPASSPPLAAEGSNVSTLSEPDYLDLETGTGKSRSGSTFTPLSASPEYPGGRPLSGDWAGIASDRNHRDELLPSSARTNHSDGTERDRQTRSLTPTLPSHDIPSDSFTDRSHSPPPLPTREALERALALSNRLSASNIPSQVTDTGDLMLDMTGYKSSDDDALRAEVIARKILSEELEGNYDIGALIGADEHGNLWIYSSEEAKEAASQRAALAGISTSAVLTSDAASDPGYHSDADSDTLNAPLAPTHRRADSDSGTFGLETPPKTPPESTGDPNRNYAKTLRLTSDQLKSLCLKPGPNLMSFTVNRATCQAYMYLWRYDVPIVISDIDGTITKSDALGHVLNMIGRDWTHIGVAKLYTEIVNNGYNIMYLTSRSVGQADNTRAYLSGVVQESYRLPKGPTIMSPDRTIAALRRELYIRKPEVFKMACLRDIKNLFGPNRDPFYAGFGNKLTDALSYRSVSIPSNRIFTINSYAEVSLDLLSLNKLRYSYVNMREVVDHYFPPVSTLVKGGGEEYTDFTYWRDPVLDIDDFSGSDSDDGDVAEEDNNASEEEEDGINEALGDSFISRDSIDDNDEENDENEENELNESILSGSVDEEDQVAGSILEGERVGLEEEGPNEDTQVIDVADANRSDSVQRDLDAEAITGLKGLSLEREDSDDKQV